MDWKCRGKLMAVAIDTVPWAWSGAPFVHNGIEIRVTPVPKSRAHPWFFMGGASVAVARFAARYGLPFYAPWQIPAVNQAYDAALAEFGNEGKGFVFCCERAVTMLFVAEDPEACWQRLDQ